MAIGVLHRAYDGGLRVPEDLSVIGFDDILFAEFTQPSLTTVALPRAEIGKVAFQALSAMLADPDLAGREFRVGTRLVMRQSADSSRGNFKELISEILFRCCCRPSIRVGHTMPPTSPATGWHQATLPNGQTRETSLWLKADADLLTGYMSSNQGDIPIAHGKITGQ